MARPFKDETGKRYGEWLVLHRVPGPSPKQGVHWVCRCDCGNVRIVQGSNLRSGRSRRCEHNVDLAHLTIEERLMRHVEVAEGHWLWTAFVHRVGYGLAWVDGKTQLAHRVMYQAVVGEIPEGLQLDHLCNVRRCVNPDHLEPVTNAENSRRARERSRSVGVRDV